MLITENKKKKKNKVPYDFLPATYLVLRPSSPSIDVSPFNKIEKKKNLLPSVFFSQFIISLFLSFHTLKRKAVYSLLR